MAMTAMSMRQRKGIFFTIMALLVVAFLLTTERVSMTPLTANLADTSAAQQRASVMNTYMETFEAQASNSLATAGYFALQNMSARIGKDGKFIRDMNATVDACVRTAPDNCMITAHQFNTTMKALTGIAKSNLSIDTNYTIDKVWVSEERPFEIIFWMNISYNISDPFANWTTGWKVISASVDVTDINDPVYEYANFTNKTQHRAFSRTKALRGKFTNSSIFEQQYYTNKSYLINPGKNDPGTYTYGPSVLQRYNGQWMNGSACCGIESVVYWYDINESIRTSKLFINTSFVDFMFVNSSGITLKCNDLTSSGISKINTTAMPPSHLIRIDNHRLETTYWNMSEYRNATCER